MANYLMYGRILWSALLNRKTASRTITQEIGMFSARPVSSRTVRLRLQQRGLSAWRPLPRFSLKMQHRERQWLWWTEQGNWWHDWYNIVFLDKSRFSVHYSDSHISVWRLWGDQTSPAWIRYQHRGPAPSMMVCAAIGYTTLTSLIRIDGNLNADQYISEMCSGCAFL